MTRKPGGATTTASRCDIHTGCFAGWPAKSTASGSTVGGGAPELGDLGALHRAAERLGHHLEAVADAERRHPGVEERGVDARCAVGVDAGRAAGEDHRRRVLRPASRPPASRGARSRCRRAPRGRGGRSAARTAHRSRPPGRGRAASNRRPADSSVRAYTAPSVDGPELVTGTAHATSSNLRSRNLARTAGSRSGEDTMANPTLNPKRFGEKEATTSGRHRSRSRHGSAGVLPRQRRAHDRQRRVRQDLRAVPHRAGRRRVRVVADNGLEHEPDRDPLVDVALPLRGARPRAGVRVQAEDVAVHGSHLRDRRRVALGAISKAFEIQWDGIVFQAVLATVGVFFATPRCTCSAW